MLFQDTPNPDGRRRSQGGWIIIAGDPSSLVAPERMTAARRGALFRQKAAEVRGVADRIADRYARRTLMQVAHHYERLADRIDRRSPANAEDRRETGSSLYE